MVSLIGFFWTIRQKPPISGAMNIFQRRESEVRSYIRSFPVLFEKATGAKLIDREGQEYIDFFAGAGALNYGHNPGVLKQALIRYLEADGVTHSLDMATEAKEQFLERFSSRAGSTTRCSSPGRPERMPSRRR
jgi:diaminobutyrate-2-oxoglutarate transaminase